MQTRSYPDVPPDFGHWLAGFIDGEGCFSIEHIHRPSRTASCYACRFTLRLRNDDLPILENILLRTGCGKVVRYKDKARAQWWNSKPAAIWHVFSKEDCLRLVALLDEYPLRAKKARDYAVWREAVVAWQGARRTTIRGRNAAVWATLASCKERLQSGRLYLPPGLPKELESDAVASADQLVLGEGIEAGKVRLVPPAEA